MYAKIMKALVRIEKLLNLLVSNDMNVLIEENKKLKTGLKESNKLNSTLKGELTKLKNKMKEVK